MGINRTRAIQLIREVGAAHRPEPVRLATGELTHVYLDVKGVLVTAERLRIARMAMVEHIYERMPHLCSVTAIGGPTMGADVLAQQVVCAPLGDKLGLQWFSVRDRRKTDHGLGLWIEGKRLGSGDRVILTDDVANSGHSLVEAYDRIVGTGATVGAVMPLVDRSGKAQRVLRKNGIQVPYLPVMDYTDLGLEPLAA